MKLIRIIMIKNKLLMIYIINKIKKLWIFTKKNRKIVEKIKIFNKNKLKWLKNPIRSKYWRMSHFLKIHEYINDIQIIWEKW
jgi:hypothetical protein